MRGLADGGRGVVVVTHATSSLSLCDTVVVMAPGGRVRFVGPPAEALTHFGVSAYDEIYDLLGEIGDDGHEHGDETLLSDTPLPPRVRAPTLAPMGPQVAAMSSRYLRCLVRDQRTLLILLLQAPIIGLCIGFVLPRDVLSSSQLGSFYAIILTFLLVTGSVWLGIISSCREIVKERTIVARELAAGARVDAYVVAKVLILFPFVALQVVILVAVVVIVQPLGASSNGYIEVGGLCLLVSFAAVGLGLALSSLVKSSDQATSTVPLLLIPQLLFAGAIIPLSVMPAPVKLLADATFARWALAGLGSAIGLAGSLNGDVSSVAGYSPGFYSLSTGESGLILVAFTFGLLVLTGYWVNTRISR
jgi:ABC-type multidrug transport system permease subunit